MSGFRLSEDVFPASLLSVAPADEDDMAPDTYVVRLLDSHPALVKEAMPYLTLDELWDVYNGAQFSDDVKSVEAMSAMADHPACDFALALSLAIHCETGWYVEADPATFYHLFQDRTQSLARTLAKRLATGHYPFSESDRRTSRAQIADYQRSLPETGGWRLPRDQIAAAMEHADRVAERD